MNVRLTEEQKIRILNSVDIYTIMKQVLLRENKIRRNQEHFWVIGLDNSDKILFIELISLGAVNKVQVKPREVFRMAIYKLAVQMILVHNHPSGNVNPSEEDRDLTDRMMKSGDMLGITVIDHLIITEEKYLSFADRSILRELKENGRYQLIEREADELKQWKIEVEKEKAVAEFAIEMAKKMKEMGYDIDTIKKAYQIKKVGH